MKRFTKKQIQDWRRYESLRRDGIYNMFDPRARAILRMSRERYLFVMKNYSALKLAAEKEWNAPNKTTPAR